MTDTERSTPAPVPDDTGSVRGRRIVVGVDASEGSTAALAWASGEARARKIPVHAVLAWEFHPHWVDPGLGSMFPMGHQPTSEPPENEYAEVAAAVDRLLQNAIRDARASDPDCVTDPVSITHETVEGHPAQVLLASVRADDTMVVGSHGHGGFVGAMLGSISQHVVAHSKCPVVVIPAPQRTT